MEESHESAASRLTSPEISIPAEPEPKSKESCWKKFKGKFFPGALILLLICLIIYIAMIIIGIWGIHKCPVEDNIPIFLIGAVGIGLLSKATSVVRVLKQYRGKFIIYVELSFYSIHLLFLLLGSYWVFKEYKPSYDPVDHLHYCNKAVYLFAFIYLVVFDALFAIALIWGCGIVIFGIACGDTLTIWR